MEQGETITLPRDGQPVLDLADIAPGPPTRDPFDRLLLAQVSCEQCALLTMDRALAGHPLGWQAQPQP